MVRRTPLVLTALPYRVEVGAFDRQRLLGGDVQLALQAGQDRLGALAVVLQTPTTSRRSRSSMRR